MRKSKRRLEMGEEAWRAWQKERMVSKVVRYRQRLKMRFVDEYGGKCKKCGYDKRIPDAYAFHHREGEDKEFSLARNYGKSQESIRKELDKCDLLCVLCHAETHFDMRK